MKNEKCRIDNGLSKKGLANAMPFFAAPHVVSLSNQFYEDLKLLKDLSVFIDVHEKNVKFQKSLAG